MSDQPKLGKIDPGKIELDELVEVEQLVGRKLGREMATGDLGIDTMRGLIWVVLRRSSPNATLAQAGKLTLEELLAVFEDEEAAAEPDPTDATSSSNGAMPNDEPSSNSSPVSVSSGG